MSVMLALLGLGLYGATLGTCGVFAQSHKIEHQPVVRGIEDPSSGNDQPVAAASTYPGASGVSYDSSPQSYGFSCYGKKPALYGDGNYDCRIFHVCQADGRQDTLYCPKQTRFNNYLGVCDWESKIDPTCMPLYVEENYNAQLGGAGNYGGQQQYGGNYPNMNIYRSAKLTRV